MYLPMLDEGDLLYMPTALPGLSAGKAGELLQQTDRMLKTFPEVARVFGKSGRAETATDPAQLDMNESVVLLKPREEWPLRPVERWYSASAPDGLKPLLRLLWPDQARRTQTELTRDLDRALRMPGYQLAISPPIRTRIDMLTTGVRTPVGIKVFGSDLAEIERLSIELEGLLRNVSGLTPFSDYQDFTARGFRSGEDEVTFNGTNMAEMPGLADSASARADSAAVSSSSRVCRA